jgi:hypothetical protein
MKKLWDKYRFNFIITIIAVGGYFYGYENGVDVNREKVEYYTTYALSGTGDINFTIWKTIKYNIK